MNLKQTYEKYKSNLFGYGSSYLENIRTNLIDHYDLDPKKLKNNESTKHFDTKVLNNFVYNPLSGNYFFPIINVDKKIFYPIQEKNELVLEKIKQYENAFEDDYIVNLNTIFQNSGIISEIEENTKTKISIRNQILNENTVFSKNFIKINQNSNITIIEKFDNDKNSNMNIMNYFEIQKNSKILHLVFQENSKKDNLQYTNYVNCYEGSEYKQIIFNASQSSTRNHSYANLLESNSRADLQGIFFGSGNQVIDNKTVVNHFAPSCSSDQKYKGILTDSAKGSYLSKTYVDQKAQKTEAYQLSKGILLSQDSYFHSKPELKIFADDVKCSHGSTIGPFDQNILFYCRSRGIPKDTATSLLINSFFFDILDDIEDPEYFHLVNNSVNNWLNHNNY